MNMFLTARYRAREMTANRGYFLQVELFLSIFFPESKNKDKLLFFSNLAKLEIMRFYILLHFMKTVIIVPIEIVTHLHV